jgi:hypothetical protein
VTDLLFSLHKFMRLLINISISDEAQLRKLARSREIVSGIAAILKLVVCTDMDFFSSGLLSIAIIPIFFFAVYY